MAAIPNGMKLQPNTPYVLAGTWSQPGSSATQPATEVIREDLDGIGVRSAFFKQKDEIALWAIMPTKTMTAGTVSLVVSARGGVGSVWSAEGLPDALLSSLVSGAEGVDVVEDVVDDVTTIGGWMLRYWWVVLLVLVALFFGVLVLQQRKTIPQIIPVKIGKR